MMVGSAWQASRWVATTSASGAVAAILLVGGSSRIPLVADLLRQHIGLPPSTIDQPETVVAEGSTEAVPLFVCTTLVDEGGAQNITLNVALPSVTSPDGYSFFVPGVESARLNLIVP